MYTPERIIQALHAKTVLLNTPKAEIHHLLMDSRKLAYPGHSLFFALKGERHDGHAFLHELYAKGVRSFLVEDVPSDLHNFQGANIIQVDSAVRALQKLAQFHRKQYTYPTIAITGSNGKTIVKEWISQLLQPHYTIVKSPKSYNSQIGVPLAIWQMSESYSLGIFEAGISQPGEMEHLEHIIQPTLGVFTNIGSAHDEGFLDRSQKIREKLKLFARASTLMYCADHTSVAACIEEVFSHKNIKLIRWSRKNQAVEVFLKHISPEGEGLRLEVTFQENTYYFRIPFQDEASLENLMHCVCVALYLGVPPGYIDRGLQGIRALEMRLRLKEGVQQSYLIDDSYNNDLAGLEIALDFLEAQKAKPRKVVILSDLLESGMHPEALYRKIAALLREKGIHKLIGIGEEISAAQGVFSLEKEFYATTAEFLQTFRPQEISNATVLVKGARVFGFEQIVEKLQKKSHGTVLEIDLDALVHNLNFYRSHLRPGTRLMIMVKAFAYGSGSAEVAALLQFHRVDYLAVAYADEGVFLRENGIHLPIMVMNPEPATFDKLVAHQLEPELYSFRILDEFLRFLHKTGRETYPIHLKIDTGMHRLGFEADDIERLKVFIREKFPGKLRVKSMFSHLSAADESIHEAFSQQQIHRFVNTAQELEAILGYSFIRHILNSPGILRFPEAHLDMVRLGIGLYGIEPNLVAQHKLMPISTLKTSISQIKDVPKGETIGYGRRGKAITATKIATIAIGYADGFSRQLSNGTGTVLVRGKEAPVIGNVCMDMTMIDVSGIPAEEGDEVIIFSPEHSIQQIAQKLSTIPYEILTGVSQRVKRVFYAK